MNTQSIASGFARAVLHHPKLNHGAVRLGLWLAAVAEKQGAFPVSAYRMTFIDGLHTDKLDAPGVNFRYETVNKSIKELEDNGLLRVQEDPSLPPSPRNPRLYTLTVADDE